MIISVINHANGLISDEKLHTAIRAINRQITQDFEPYWSLGATLRLEGRSGKQPDVQQLADMRGEAVIYLWDQVDVDDALGYHERNNRGIPYSFVFPTISKALGEEWSTTLSHEALETIADPEVNLLVQGPHPSAKNRYVFHWYEMCDAVQAESYEIDGIQVSNFVLPLYFTGGEESEGRNDFLGRVSKRKTLRSFGVKPGGYIGYFDPRTGTHETFAMKGDRVAEKRWKIKDQAAKVRRANRYRRSYEESPVALARRM